MEIDCKYNPQAEQVLTIKRLGNQEVTIERQARRLIQFSATTAGPLVIAKIIAAERLSALNAQANMHPLNAKKARALQAFVQIAAMHTLPRIKAVYKAERSKLLAAKLSIPPATLNKNYHAATEQQQLFSPPQKTEIPHNEIHLDPKQFSNDNQINSINAKRPNWQPLQQRFSRRPVNMSPINPHKLANNNPEIDHKLTNNVKNQKTYSQVAYEASVNSPFESSRKMHTPAHSNVPHPPTPPHPPERPSSSPFTSYNNK